MTIEKLLSENRAGIIKRWVQLTLETYPSDSRRFLKKRKDRFANPVGTTLTGEIEKLYDAFLEGADEERISPALEKIIRIRAVQDFTPAQAVSFVFLLKGIVRAELGRELEKPSSLKALLDWDSRVDAIALLAFDIYGKCREDIYNIRTNEVRNQFSRLLRRAGLVVDISNGEQNISQDNYEKR